MTQNEWIAQAVAILNDGVALMTPDQLAQWSGVRALLESAEQITHDEAWQPIPVEEVVHCNCVQSCGAVLYQENGILIIRDSDGLMVTISLPEDYAICRAAQQLEPDWSTAPDWAQWWAVDANGLAAWYPCKPCIRNTVWLMPDGGYPAGIDKRVELPLGVDWRTTLRQRPTF